MKAYKGFNKDMTCRGFQFEEGKTYEEKEAKLCESGFHACENPLDCYNYYGAANSVFHEVELDGLSEERHDDDTKVAAKKITIGARLDVAGIVKAHFEYVTSRCAKVDGSVAGDRESVAVNDKHACSAGESGSASAGNWGSASAGKNGLAACRSGKVKGGIGCMLALCEIDSNGNNKHASAALVDGKTIKADTWYTLKNGKFVEVEA